MVPRFQYDTIMEHLGRDRAIILYGPKQSGKTTLLKFICSRLDNDFLWLNGYENADGALLADNSGERLSKILGNHKYLIIDEAEEVKDDLSSALTLISLSQKERKRSYFRN